MKRVITKPVTGTVEIATKNTVNKKAPNMTADLKNPKRKNIGQLAGIVLMDVRKIGTKTAGAIAAILTQTAKAMAGEIQRATTKPVIGTMGIATPNMEQRLTEVDVLLDV